MRSKILFATLLFTGCYKSTGAETCSPVPTSWSAPVQRCVAVVATPPASAPEPIPAAAPAPAPPPAKTEITQEQIKLHEKIEFQTDSAVILPTSDGVLDEVVEILKDHPEIEHVRVAGHTDSTSTPAHNMKLSEARATAVKAYLVNHGIGTDRLASKGYGQTRPIADNATEDGRAQNRRVEIRILRHKGETKDSDPDTANH
ncbi:MAG: OmpA family protein [Kofleriaceae bacterium]